MSTQFAISDAPESPIPKDVQEILRHAQSVHALDGLAIDHPLFNYPGTWDGRAYNTDLPALVVILSPPQIYAAPNPEKWVDRLAIRTGMEGPLAGERKRLLARKAGAGLVTGFTLPCGVTYGRYSSERHHKWEFFEFQVNDKN